MQITTNEMVLFWQADTIYSNWYSPSVFTITDEVFEDITFSNSEAAFMYCKAMFFGDSFIANLIYKDQNPKNCKAYGHQIKNYNDDLWTKVRFEVMYDVCKAKFAQNSAMKAALLATGDRILVEASPFDKVWGIGLAPNDPLALDRKNWKGTNLLGEVLMMVREHLK